MKNGNSEIRLISEVSAGNVFCKSAIRILVHLCLITFCLCKRLNKHLAEPVVMTTVNKWLTKCLNFCF